MDSNPTSTGSPHRRCRPEGRRWRALAAASVLLWARGAAADATLLPPEEAFRFSARALDERMLEARFTIADGYYLYRDKLRFALSTGESSLGAPELPAGRMKHDEFFGNVETYRGTVVVRLPVAGAARGQALELAADSQGCADAGVCYPPTRQKITLTIPGPGRGPGLLQDATPPKKNWFQ
jgi:thiol:disulfide interchange protein DsbD